jgi:hypothetical protein
MRIIKQYRGFIQRKLDTLKNRTIIGCDSGKEVYKKLNLFIHNKIYQPI